MRIFVNGEMITEEQIKQEMDFMREAHDRSFSDLPQEKREEQLKEWAKENVIERVLLAQEARRRNYEIDDSVIVSRLIEMTKDKELTDVEKFKLKNDLKLETRVELLLEEIRLQVKEPSEKELRKYYEENPQMFRIPGQVNIAQIVVYINQAQNKAQAYQKIYRIQEQLKAGESFENLAQTKNECTDWQLGWYPKGQLPRAFEDVVFRLKPGEISDIILTESGYHIAKVYDHLPEKLNSFDEVKSQIRKYLINDLAEKKVYELVDLLKKKTKIIEEK